MTCGFSCVINKHWCKNGDFDETHDLLPIFFKWRIGEWMMRGNLLLRIFSLTLLRVCWQSSCAGCNTFYNFLKVSPACPWTFQSLLYTATNELWQSKKPRFFSPSVGESIHVTNVWLLFEHMIHIQSISYIFYIKKKLEILNRNKTYFSTYPILSYSKDRLTHVPAKSLGTWMRQKPHTGNESFWRLIR